MPINISSKRPCLDKLPSTFLIALTQYSAIKLAGPEQTKYLQGQVTCDVTSIEEHGLLVGAHCDAKGKVFNVFRLINRLSAHLLIQNKSSLEASLAELKKFGVFAKVDINKTDDLSFYALVGEKAAQLIQQEFNVTPDSLNPVVQSGSTTIVYIASAQEGSIQSRYILIDENTQTDENDAEDSDFIAALSRFNVPCLNSQLWDLLEITQGFPQFSAENSGQYVPQMLNLQAIKGISFTKGCYLGQETVARMQYLGKNKRALFALKGHLSTRLQADDVIEKQLGENWRKAGEVLSSYQSDEGECYIQAVLSSDLYTLAENATETVKTESKSALRIKSLPESRLTIAQLPYTLNN